MTRATLHYIYDPFCGWCYGATPLVVIAETLPGLTIALHAGGMMAGNRRRPVSEALRQYVMPHDRRIAAVTGQPFGDAYFNDLLCDTTAMFDSEPPITAVLAAESLGHGVAMLKRIQLAHYAEGRRIADEGVLAALAVDIGLNPEDFARAYATFQGEPTTAHIADSLKRLSLAGGRGFPTFVLERDRHFEMFDLSRYLGQPDAWRAVLQDRLGTQP